MKRLRYLFPAMVWLIIITALSLVSASRLNVPKLQKITGIDLLAHFVMYSVLTFLLLWGVQKTNWNFRNRNNAVIIFSILFGILMETLQYCIGNGRNFDLFDIIANIVGTFLGSIFFLSRSNF